MTPSAKVWWFALSAGANVAVLRRLVGLACCTGGAGLFFFFQAEDGIRDYKVTGVQTCALPICDDEAGHRVDPGGVAQRDEVEPPRAPRAPRGGPVLAAAAAQLVAQRTVELADRKSVV